MTKEEIEDRIDLLWNEIADNNEDNYYMQNEIDKLDKLLEDLENE